MLRTTPLLRALPTSSSCLSTTTRTIVASSSPLSASRTHQRRNAHAISNPTLANIEKRWEAMPPQEQADLWMALRDRMQVDWNEMTLQEKKAAYWIAFGPHGPRAQAPPGESMKIFLYTIALTGVGGLVFAMTRYFAKPAPRTMTKEWQEASNEYLKENNIEPISGVSSEGYKGPGMVQSKPGPKES